MVEEKTKSTTQQSMQIKHEKRRSCRHRHHHNPGLQTVNSHTERYTNTSNRLCRRIRGEFFSSFTLINNETYTRED
jgi:hypothetical protein